ncbi:hypothetical protein PLEOSDRAFT_1041851 [Pleurotus ostreatus PC15]|uniref:Cyclase family protein n=1 Tax=Pleurotus ostreatus (strain PC15) TaxID=1137138 RepID=A0A067NXS4_PLEO1|nr:hypothetical protein PLEOSDRAFT_1041851 [Pleurotus ostreatus PC15]
MQTYPGDPLFQSYPHASIKPDGYAVSRFSIGSHTGTHVDAPSHFIDNGRTIDQIPLGKIDWDSDLAIYADRMSSGVILLIRTGWSRFWGSPEYLDHPYLTKEAAERIIATGVRAVGVDSLNPDETVIDGEGEGGFAVHEIILGAEGVIVENLTGLELVKEGMTVQFIPLKLAGSDASPVRALAW